MKLANQNSMIDDLVDGYSIQDVAIKFSLPVNLVATIQLDNIELIRQRQNEVDVIRNKITNSFETSIKLDVLIKAKELSTDIRNSKEIEPIKYTALSTLCKILKM